MLWSLINYQCIVLSNVEYSNRFLKSSSFMTPDISGYICSTTDWVLANLNTTNISKFRPNTGGIAFIYWVVKSKLHCKCLWRIVKLLIAELPFLKALAPPTKSSNTRNLILGYLYGGCGTSFGYLKSNLDNINSSSGNNIFIFSSTLYISSILQKLIKTGVAQLIY